MAHKKECWSYNTGERGRNWVRAYEKGQGGIIFVEYFAPVPDEEGRPALDPATGQPKLRRTRISLGHRDRSKARKQADKLADHLAEAKAVPATLSLRRLIHLYLREVTPTKGKSKQDHDRRAARLFLGFFDSQPDPKRRSDRAPTSLDRQDWDGFVSARRAGQVPDFGAGVRDRVIEYDLKFLVSVLAWAEGASEGKPHHIVRNPWSRERRKAQGMAMPREKNPNRPSVTDDQHAALVDASPNWRFDVVLELCRETMHRRNSVRLLQWTDVDLEGRTVLWRGEFDKNGVELRTPLTDRAVEVLQRAPKVPESPWVVPAPENPAEAVSIHVLNLWLQRAKARAGVNVKGLGFHGQKRAGVRRKEFRELPAKVQEALTGTNHETLRRVYDDVSLEDMREAVARLQRGAEQKAA